ncbi:c-type cytochrome biogenesis protein CcmI [Rothia sp. HC945]|uniref:c-type cytochrome biogenesis protein CcmI n=1 Tax=Rothia sp. HC945 TaxID=3171170 RepID=UPI003F210D79
MGIFSAIFSAPFAPLRGTVWVAEQVRDEAEKQFYDRGKIRRQLEEVADARRDGRLDDSEADQLERELVGRLLEATRRNKSKEQG